MILNDIPSALPCFEEACQLFDIHYGKGAPECGEVYLNYGIALFEYSHLDDNLLAGNVCFCLCQLCFAKCFFNSGVEANGQNEVDDENEEESDEEADNEAADPVKADEEADKAVSAKGDDQAEDGKLCPINIICYFSYWILKIDKVKQEADNSSSHSEPVKCESSTAAPATSNGEPSSSNGEPSSYNGGPSNYNAEPSSSNDYPDVSQPSTSTGIVKGESDPSSFPTEEDASNVEIAWEVLNLAKDIFTDQVTKEGKLNLAETLYKLGEIALEWENSVQAAAFLSESLDLRKEVLLPDDRLISEVYYSLGLAFHMGGELDKASSCFENSRGIIQLRLENLQKKNIDDLSQFDKDAHAKEIRQLEGILPDIQVKIDDLKEAMTSNFQTKEALEAEAQAAVQAAAPLAAQSAVRAVVQSAEAANQAGPPKPVKDISYLIKRKVCLLLLMLLHLSYWYFFVCSVTTKAKRRRRRPV